MRKVTRDKDTHEYWNERWAAYGADAESFVNTSIYPIKYVDRIMKPGLRTLEAGCGLGRVVKHYRNQGHDIEGFDYSEVAVAKLNAESPQCRIKWGDITRMDYADGTFDNVLALGVFHGIEDLGMIRRGIGECARTLKPGGHLVASVRADTWENRLIDDLTSKRGKKGEKFHKWSFTEAEFAGFLEGAGLRIVRSERVTNVPYLHKYAVFRKRAAFEEGDTRSEGFLLNGLGNALYGVFRLLLPGLTGTTWVFTAVKGA